MTDAVQLAVIAAIAPTLAALAALSVGIINGRKAADNGTKLTEIHTLTNSTLSKVQSALEVAQAKIDGLEKLISANAASKKVSDDLAAQKSPTS